MSYEELVLRADAIFSKCGSIVTGEGLSRKELRLLERKGHVKRRLMQIKDTGAIINQWRPVLVSEGLIKK